MGLQEGGRTLGRRVGPGGCPQRPRLPQGVGAPSPYGVGGRPTGPRRCTCSALDDLHNEPVPEHREVAPPPSFLRGEGDILCSFVLRLRVRGKSEIPA